MGKHPENASIILFASSEEVTRAHGDTRGIVGDTSDMTDGMTGSCNAIIAGENMVHEEGEISNGEDIVDDVSGDCTGY